jgi:hypothetical protein
MKIALDYDGTFTADRTLWLTFVALAKKRGHEVSIVTARIQDVDDNTDVEEDAQEMGIPVVYCGLKQKQDCFGADIWIDDRPDMVLGREQVDHMYGVLNCS